MKGREKGGRNPGTENARRGIMDVRKGMAWEMAGDPSFLEKLNSCKDARIQKWLELGYRGLESHCKDFGIYCVGNRNY